MSKIPDKPGWWWWKSSTDNSEQALPVVIMFRKLCVSCREGGLFPLKDFTKLRNGYWLGPCYKPGESFTVGEIVRYFTAKTPYVGLKHIGDKKHGIKAFTERTNK